MYKSKLGQYKTSFGQYKLKLGQYKMLIQQNQAKFGTVQGDEFKLYKVSITNTSRWNPSLEQDDKWANYWDIKDDISCPINNVLGSTSDAHAT